MKSRRNYCAASARTNFDMVVGKLGNIVESCAGKTIVITIDLLFDVEAFTPNLSNWFCTVPHPPADTENDFRFKVLRKEVA